LAETFSCPMCGAPLTYQDGDGTTITCPYCHNSVVVPQEVRHVLPDEESEAGNGARPAAPYNIPLSPAEAVSLEQALAPQVASITPVDKQALKLFGIITVGSVVLPFVITGITLLCIGGIVAIIVIYSLSLVPH
jgi:hypothetical protein